MPIINGEWVAPSALIAEMGLSAYQAQFEPHDIDFASLAKPKTKKRGAVKKAAPVSEENEVPETPLDARPGFTFGCDPELFVFKDGKPVTAEGLIPGTKEKPFAVHNDQGEEVGAVQVDGMAAEFNIPAVSTFRDFNRYIESTMKILEGMLPVGHELRAIPAVTFDKETFDAAPDKAKELGCSPDYDAWSRRVNPPPKDPSNPYLRTASGHLHIGWTEDADFSDTQHLMNCCDLTQQFDWFLGAWSIKHDPDPIRRRLYGRAGSCRIKSYGVEYRVLSNFWIVNRGMRLAVWNRMQHAIEAMQKNFMPDRQRAYNGYIKDAINSATIDPSMLQNFKYPLVSTQPALRSGF